MTNVRPNLFVMPQKNAPKTANETSEVKPKRARRKKPVLGSRGLPAAVLLSGADAEDVASLARSIEADGGAVLASYRDPLGAHPVIFAGLPIELVEPTPFQRDLSEAHAKRLASTLDALGIFLDPIIAIRRPDGKYWTPNGRHRLEAMKQLGARSLVSLVLPDERVAYRILALNTEKAHNVREKALEVMRMARSLADTGAEGLESDYALEFEEPALLTLGLAYEARPRFSGSSYHGLLREAGGFLDLPLAEALERREKQADKLCELDDRVTEIAAELRARGVESPYLKAFIVARLKGPLRHRRGEALDFDEAISRMLEEADRFDVTRIRPEHLARAGGPPAEEAA